MSHDFSDAERWAERFDSPERAAWQKPEEVVALMKLSSGDVVADIGAGTGYFLPHLQLAVGEEGSVVAVDVEKTLVDHMTKRAQTEGWKSVDVRLTTPDDPGLKAGEVDRVLIVNTWHHIPDRRAYMQRLGAVLKDGGAIFIVDFTMETEMGPPREHRLAPEVVVEAFEAAGFDAEVVEESLPQQYIVVARPGR